MAYITVAEFKEYANFDTGTDDALLASLIANAEQIIDTHTGREFAVSGLSSRSLDALADVDGRYLYLDADCNEITAIINGDGEVLDTDVYVVQPRNITPIYSVKLLGSSGISWTFETDPENAITISGYWGYSQEAPLDIKQASLRLTGWLYHQREAIDNVADSPLITPQGVIMPAILPKDVLSILDSYQGTIILS